MPATYRQYDSYQPHQPTANYPSKKRPHHFKHGLLIICSLSTAALIYGANLSRHAAASAQADAKAAAKIQQAAELSKKINSLIAKNPRITFSASLIDLSSGDRQDFGVAKPMTAASVAKLLTATLYLHNVELGRASLTQLIGSYTANHQLEQLIRQSSESAWQLLNRQLGRGQLNAYAKEIGLKSYDSENKTMSASDVATLLEKLYKGELLNQKNTKLLLGYMQNTNHEEFIPPAVPKSDNIYHKVGLLGDYVHDAALITNHHSTVALVIFTNGNGLYNWTQRADLMQEITKAAIDTYLE